MSGSSSSSRSSSSSSLDELENRYSHPLFSFQPKPEPEKKDWVKIGSIVAAVAGALIFLLGLACFKGIFPIEFLGSQVGAGFTMVAGFTILLPAGLIFIEKWKGPMFGLTG